MVTYLDSSTIQEARESPLWWHRQGLQQTASGYGKKLTTEYMLRISGRWHRVYCVCFSNGGSLYVLRNGAAHYLDIDARYMLETLRDKVAAQ